MRWFVGLWILCAPLAWADVVHLTSGRKIKGEVVSESDTKVVVRVAGMGRMEFPRKLVERIERESQGATRLAQARERSREGAWEAALALYRTLVDDADPAVAEAARRELTELEQARAAAKRERAKPTPPRRAEGRPSPAAPTAPAALGPAAKGLAALRAGEFAEARDVFAALLEAEPKSEPYAFLLARALELGGETRAAGQRYRALAAELGARRGLTPAWLGEIARRRLGGESLTPDSPGVGEGWSRVEAGDAFVIYHPFPKIEAWLEQEPERALVRVLERLKIERERLEWNGRVQIYLFPNQRAYQEAEGMELAGGHAQRYRAPDGWLTQIRAYPQRSFYQTTFPHEVAHAVLYTVYPGLPSWAHEGAAQYVETPRSRARARAAFRGAEATASLPSLRELLAGAVNRGANQAEVAAFYGLSLVAFEALVELSGGPNEALELCREIRLQGAEAALKSRSISWRRLESALESAAKNTAAGD